MISGHFLVHFRWNFRRNFLSNIFIAPKDSSSNSRGNLPIYFWAISLISAVITTLEDFDSILPARTVTVKESTCSCLSLIWNLSKHCKLYADPFDPEAPFDSNTASDDEIVDWIDRVMMWADENDKEGFQIETRAHWLMGLLIIWLAKSLIDFETKKGSMRQIYECWYSVRAGTH